MTSLNTSRPEIQKKWRRLVEELLHKERLLYELQTVGTSNVSVSL